MPPFFATCTLVLLYSQSIHTCVSIHIRCLMQSDSALSLWSQKTWYAKANTPQCRFSVGLCVVCINIMTKANNKFYMLRAQDRPEGFGILSKGQRKRGNTANYWGTIFRHAHQPLIILPKQAAC